MGATLTHSAQEKREAFLTAIADGQTVTQAAELVDVPRRTVYNWKRDDPVFAASWEECYDVGTDYLERVAQERAVNGSDLLLIFLLKGRRPGKYRDNVRHEVTGAGGGPIEFAVAAKEAREQLISRTTAIAERRRDRASLSAAE